jgi:hypothetical protein
MHVHTIGIDLGKTVFHLVGLSPTGAVVVRKKFSRAQLLRFTSNVQVDLIGMEAGAGSHFLGKALREQGHEVRLMPAQYVKPFVKTNKNDFIDAEVDRAESSHPHANLYLPGRRGAETGLEIHPGFAAKPTDPPQLMRRSRNAMQPYSLPGETALAQSLRDG